MRKIYLLAAAIGLSAFAGAQSFSDDFESYTVGSYIGASSADWTTWTGVTGGSADAMVVNDTANSDSNSIYFYSTAQGPQDVVLPFGNAYSNGHFQYEMMMLVSAGADAYFNFQAEETIGTTWAMDCNLDGSGSMSLSNQGGALFAGTYPNGQWFRLGFDINLNLNEWTVYVDSVAVGSFSNTVNKIASIDIFPLIISGSGSTVSEFWVDDVFYSYETITLPNLDAAVTSISGLSGLVSQEKKPIITVKNLGVDAISSFDLEVAYNGITFNESITGVSIASLEDYEVALNGTIELAAGSSAVVATVSNVNGTTSDDDASNDSKSLTINPVLPGLHKRVLVEEATGTWCQWCPRGAVWMARMQERYPDHFVGVAVHNGDPMANEVYDTGLGDYISGYPSSIVDRGADIDPSGMEIDFIERVQMTPSGILCESVTYNEGDTTINLSLQVVLTDAITSDWKIAFIVTEDSVTGLGSGYNQSNAYAGGGSGELSGAGLDWHNEPASVPASKMVYNHVGRAIAPSFNGLVNSFPNGGASGDTFNFTTTINLGQTWSLEHLHVAAAFFNPDGDADNALVLKFEEARDLDCAFGALSTTEVDAVKLPALQVFPNPANDRIAVRISENTETNAVLQIRDLLGKVVMQTNVNALSGINDVQLDIRDLNSGIYMVELTNGYNVESTKFIKR